MTWARFNGDESLAFTWVEPVQVSGENGADGADGADGVDGSAGPFIYFRGSYDAATEYTSDAFRRDIVLWDNDGAFDGAHYITVPGIGSFTNKRPDVALGSHWIKFSDFSNIATDILLANDVAVTRKITLGVDAALNKGILNSVLATAFLVGKGFWIDTDGNARFGDPSGQHMKFDAGTGELTVASAIINDATITDATITDATVEGTLQASNIQVDDVRVFNSAEPTNVMRVVTRLSETWGGQHTSVNTSNSSLDSFVLSDGTSPPRPLVKFYGWAAAGVTDENGFATSDPVFSCYAIAEVARYVSIWYRHTDPSAAFVGQWTVVGIGVHNRDGMLKHVANGTLSLTGLPGTAVIEFGVSSRRGDGLFPNVSNDRRVDNPTIRVISHNW